MIHYDYTASASCDFRVALVVAEDLTLHRSLGGVYGSLHSCQMRGFSIHLSISLIYLISKQAKPTNPNANHVKEEVRATRIKCRCGVWSRKCGMWGVKCGV